MKKIALSILLLTILASTLGGCGRRQTEQRMNILKSWMGHPISKLIDSAGPPTSTAPDGRGGLVYVWQQTNTRSYTIPTIKRGTISLTGPHGQSTGTTRTTENRTYTSTNTSSQMFWVNEDGIIYQARWN